MIDNFVILVTCGAVVVVAFRALMLEWRGGQQKPPAVRAARPKLR